MLKSVTIKRLKNKGFSLILSGGAALGIAHIGVLRWLEEHAIIPDEIIGTSMGSIIGALWATGKTSYQIEEIIEEIKGVDLFRLKYTHGKLDYQKVNHFLKRIFAENKIKHTDIPLKIVATEMKTGESKVFDLHDNVLISDAVRASIAIPGIFALKKIKNKYYMDGGISSNLPVEFSMPKKIKIASNVVNMGRRFGYSEPKGIFSAIKERFVALEGSMHYLIRNQTYAKIHYIKKMVLLEPNLNKFDRYKLGDYKKMIKLGYNEAKKMIHL